MNFPKLSLLGGLLLAGLSLGREASVRLLLADNDGAAARCEAPVSVPIDLSQLGGIPPTTSQFKLLPAGETGSVPAFAITAQFDPEAPGSARGTLRWLMPAGPAGAPAFSVAAEANPGPPRMQVRRDAGGYFELLDGGQRVLRYNYQTNDPGELLARVTPDNRKYARARSDYIHPLYGLDGQELTKDWSVDHPHHRGIYWAWPEVDYRGERGDLHALQRVFARPTGHCTAAVGPVCAVVEAENLWRWEDQEPIVRERALIRAWRAGATGRFIDLEFQFAALQDTVALARRGTDKYGGLNLRLAAVQDQEILFHTDPAGTSPLRAWGQLSGVFPGGAKAALAVFPAPSNPDYPGDWIKYPELNWFQPTFPTAGTRYELKPGHPLVLRFRLWISRDKADEARLADGWAAYASSPAVTLEGR